MTMFKSIKKWLNIPIQIKPFIKYAGDGDKEFDIPVDAYCYREDKFVKVVNSAGTEVISKIQLYIDGRHEIKAQDDIVLDSKTYIIQGMAVLYDKGVRDLWVVFL